MEFLQQGDVLIKKCNVVPDGAKKVYPTQRGYVLAEGEATGHAHRIEEIAGIEFLENDGKFYIVNKKDAVLGHEEHKKITIPAGCWEVSKVREYDHFAEEAREVKD